MKVTKQKAAENRAALVEAAARLFRKRGFNQVSVAAIAREAQLTPGAFYSHFKSREDIEAAACEAVIADAAEFWERVVADHPARPIEALIAEYLDHDHLGDPGTGCAFAALGPELARSTGKARRAVAEMLPRQLDLLARLLPGSSADAMRKALAAYITLVGAVVVARAVDDKALVSTITEIATQSILKLQEAPL